MYETANDFRHGKLLQSIQILREELATVSRELRDVRVRLAVLDGPIRVVSLDYETKEGATDQSIVDALRHGTGASLNAG